MEQVLVVIDMQNDFIDGPLGTQEAQDIVPRVVAHAKAFEGMVVFTRDTHAENYLLTQEGHKLPIAHCIKGTPGWNFRQELEELRKEKDCPVFDKSTFGAADLATFLCVLSEERGIKQITLLGVCTDICVISNALLLKAFLPETQISVVANCCAGVTPESHERALAAMEVCQITILRD